MTGIVISGIIYRHLIGSKVRLPISLFLAGTYSVVVANILVSFL